MSVSSIFAVTITLCIISIFSIFSVSVNDITNTIEGTVQISAKVDYEYESAESLERIKSEIENIDGVKKITFYTKEDELNFYIEQNITNDEQRTIFAPYETEGNNPFHHMYYIDVYNGLDVETVATKIGEIEGIKSVNYGGSSAVLLVSMLNKVSYGGGILIASLGALALFLVSNTIKLTIYARKHEISIMRNVGASNGNIRTPFVIEGMLIGFIGSILPIVLTCVGYYYLYDYLGGIWFSNLFVMVEPYPFVLYLSGFLCSTGVLVGLIGSFVSVSRYLRLKR